MLQLALPVFVLMSGAALLGFIVAWTWRNLAIQTLQSELIQIKNVNYQIESERQNLVQHANILQSEKESLLRYQNELDNEKKKLTEHLSILSAEKEELERLLRQNNSNEVNAIHQEKLVELEQKLVIQHTEIRQKEEEIEKYRQQMNEQFPATEVEELKERFRKKYEEKKQKWEEKYRNLNFKLLKVARERDELKRESNPVKATNNNTDIEISSKKSLDKIKKRFNKWQHPFTVQKSTKKMGFLSSDYGEIEKNPKEDTEELIDDLQTISGITSVIEKKLNALGVYRYEQISRLEEKDILLINKILDLKPEYILKNEWVTEARKLKKK